MFDPISQLFKYKSRVLWLQYSNIHVFWFSIFCTPPHLFQPPRLLERWEYSNFQNLVISFEYSWFLAKNLTNFVSLHWKLHNRYCNTWDILIRILYSKSCSSAKSHVVQIIHGIVVHVRSDIRWIELKFLVNFILF